MNKWIGLLLIAISFAAAQDSDRVVIVSPRVGPTIDAAERERFNLFTRIADFKEAVFYRTPEKKYYARVVRTDKPDTLIGFTESLVLNRAEVINNFEAIEKGEYRMGSSLPTIEVVGADTVTRTRQSLAAPAVPGQTGFGAAKRALPDLLPFAGNTLPDDTYPDWGVGIGYAAYESDFSKIDQSFTAIENRYRSSGYAIHPHQPIVIGSMIYWKLTYRFNRTYHVALDVGIMNDDPNKVALYGVLGSYSVPLTKSGTYTLYGALGAGKYGFSFTREYGDRVSAVDQIGGFNVLEQITFSGGGTYYKAAAGIAVLALPGLTIDAFAHYVAMPVESTSISGTAVSADLSGAIAGAAISLFF